MSAHARWHFRQDASKLNYPKLTSFMEPQRNRFQALSQQLSFFIPFHMRSCQAILEYFPLFFTVFSILILVNFVLLVYLYTFSSALTDHAEAQISAVSWLVQTGEPLYHQLESAERYSLIYGPMLYLIQGAFLNLFGTSIFAAKLSGSLALVLSLVFMFLTLKKVANYKLTFISLAYVSLAILCFGSVSGNPIFQIRSDSLILMCVSLGLLGVIRGNRLTALFLCALAVGVSVNLKLSAILYFLPIYILLYLRDGAYVVASVVVASILSFAPFVLPQISLQNYVILFQKTTTHGLSIEQVQKNSLAALYLLIPVGTVALHLSLSDKKEFYKIFKQERAYLYALILSTVGIIIIAAKPGSGPHHLIPFLPFLSYLFTILLARTDIIDQNEPLSKIGYLAISFKCAYVVVFMVALSNASVKEVLTLEHFLNPASENAAEIISDLELVMQRYPGQTIEMGYGTNNNYPLTYYRPILVFSGNPYLIDSAALMDMQKAGIDIPPATTEVLGACRTKIWLIPKGDPPFEQPNYYPPSLPLFSDKFKTTFLNRYELRKQSKYFDLWFCKKGATISE